MTNNYLLKACLDIKNGPIFLGASIGAIKCCSGELTFISASIEYPKLITNPLYHGQILVINERLDNDPHSSDLNESKLLKYLESPFIHVAGIVLSKSAHSAEALQALSHWCHQSEIPVIQDVDTVKLMELIKEAGSVTARIVVGELNPVEFEDHSNLNLIKDVSVKKPSLLKSLRPQCTIAVIDCGVSESLIESLTNRGANVIVVPYDFDVTKYLHKIHGVCISGGPGNPKTCTKTVAILKNLLSNSHHADIPIFGVNLGHLLLALAAGATVSKLKYGNIVGHSSTMEVTTGKCYVTLHQSNYVADISSLSNRDWKPLFVNLSDYSNEGMHHSNKPIFSVQFQPGLPGALKSTDYIYNTFISHVLNYKSQLGSSL